MRGLDERARPRSCLCFLCWPAARSPQRNARRQDGTAAVAVPLSLFSPVAISQLTPLSPPRAPNPLLAFPRPTTKKSSKKTQSRRAALGFFGAAAAAVAAAGAPAPALAAYGDAANVFGRVTNRSGFVPYAGEGFAVLLPSKWNPSKEKDFSGVAETLLR